MHREIHNWHSPSLNKNMEIVMYGHYGFSLLLLPTAAADYLEYERFLLIDAISDYINAGKCKVFSINSINSESWLNKRMNPRHKSIRHQQFKQLCISGGYSIHQRKNQSGYTAYRFWCLIRCTAFCQPLFQTP